MSGELEADMLPIDKKQLAVSILGESMVHTLVEENRQPPDVSVIAKYYMCPLCTTRTRMIKIHIPLQCCCVVVFLPWMSLWAGCCKLPWIHREC